MLHDGLPVAVIVLVLLNALPVGFDECNKLISLNNHRVFNCSGACYAQSSGLMLISCSMELRFRKHAYNFGEEKKSFFRQFWQSPHCQKCFSFEHIEGRVTVSATMYSKNAY